MVLLEEPMCPIPAHRHRQANRVKLREWKVIGSLFLSSLSLSSHALGFYSHLKRDGNAWYTTANVQIQYRCELTPISCCSFNAFPSPTIFSRAESNAEPEHSTRYFISSSFRHCFRFSASSPNQCASLRICAFWSFTPSFRHRSQSTHLHNPTVKCHKHNIEPPVSTPSPEECSRTVRFPGETTLEVQFVSVPKSQLGPQSRTQRH